MYAQELMGCRLRKRCASHERDSADTEGISAVAQVKALRLSPTQVRWESLWQEAGVELKSPPMTEQSIDGCVTGLNCVVSAVSRGAHTRAQSKYHLTLTQTEKKKQTRQRTPPPPPPLSRVKATVISYRERLTGKRCRCYGRPWRWSRFPRTGRRNRWPQNAPHWSSEIRRPWRLSYRPPLEGGGEEGMDGWMVGWMGGVIRSKRKQRI